MSEKMTPMPFAALMSRIDADHKRDGTVFGVRRSYKADPEKFLPIFGEKLETPFGPAAGPNTQLAQNIVAGYFAGARFFELKTVQTMDGDELAACIARPCINVSDEGYNCEWSTELTVQQAFDEYVKAWCALKMMSRLFDLGGSDGFVFNMSVGYDLAGIKSEKIDGFIEGLKNASNTPVFAECKRVLTEMYPEHRDFIGKISPNICRSATLSTLHGCPPDEIERIAAYLIGEKGLNTFVKCNPTILGYKTARERLDMLGFDYVAFGEKHFNEDLQYADAVPMFRRLTALANDRGLTFGVKLSNTFPADVKAKELPSEEMYMSGRALFALTIEMAKRLSVDFGGALPISFSGGADHHNIAALFDCGIWPITMATNILKPGGYTRMAQLAELVDGKPYAEFSGVNWKKVADLSETALLDQHYRKPTKPLPERKMASVVPLTDCFTAPCRDGCPIHQDIPLYLRLAGQGKYTEALRVITERNPLPFITGTICSHRCMDKCMRSCFEGSVDIRAVKLLSAAMGYKDLLPQLKPAAKNGKKVAVIGGGPSGLASAFLLARAGCAVTVFEKTEALGGIVRHAIPGFRISADSIDKDVSLCRSMGVAFELGHEAKSLDEFADFDAVVLCTGAWIPGSLKLEKGRAENVIEFLRDFKKDPASCDLGKNVAICGGGNTAMDAARAAKRTPGVERVFVVYRRDKRNMPAEEEELNMAEADGVEFMPLLSPVSHENGMLRCEVMELGDYDATGRRSPVSTGRFSELPVDTVIAAVGERTDTALYKAFGLGMDAKGRAIVDGVTGASTVPGVYLAGDGATGPSTVVQAIAGATKAAKAIAGIDVERYAALNKADDDGTARARKCVLYDDIFDVGPADRCMECKTVCETCCDVCPNRANVSIEVMGTRQIIHEDAMCNECGNCQTFCPYSSAPYKDKFTLYSTAEALDAGSNQGFAPLGGLAFRIRFGGMVWNADLGEGNGNLNLLLAAAIRSCALRYPGLIY